LSHNAELRLAVWRELLEPFDDAAVDAFGRALEAAAAVLPVGGGPAAP